MFYSGNLELGHNDDGLIKYFGSIFGFLSIDHMLLTKRWGFPLRYEKINLSCVPDKLRIMSMMIDR